MSKLSDKDRAKLVRILGMLGSTFDGERASAGAKADKMVKDLGLTWEMVIAREKQQQDYSEREKKANYHSYQSYDLDWRHMVDECLYDTQKLTQWEFDFLESMLSRHSRQPSEKQMAIINRIHAKIYGGGR